MKTPLLVNAQEMARQHPETFLVPSDTALATLCKCDLVKVCSNDDRFWVEIESRDGDVFVGRIDNELITTGLRRDDRITFHRDNIYQVAKKGFTV